MNQQRFLDDLRGQLGRLPESEVNDILADYREHFSLGLASGKTELQIVTSLGQPRLIAQQHLMHSLLDQVKSAPSLWQRGQTLLRVMLLFLVLAPFNFLVFVGPFLVAFCVLIAGWAVPIAIASAAIFAAGLVVASSSSVALGIWTGASLFFALLGTIGLAALSCFIMFFASRLFLSMISTYVQWNIKFIGARGAAGA